MSSIDQLFANNRQWAQDLKDNDPEFFDRLAGGQAPEYLWIGCSDSRVPAAQVVGLGPGDVFVHRNVANQVVHTDLSCLTVMQYSIDVLKVKHVLVVGHYGCGGVRAAYEKGDTGLIDNWLRNIKDVQFRYYDELEAIADLDARVDRLCELNVKTQVEHVCQTTVVQNAWARGQSLAVHGLIYSLKDGLLKNLDCSVDSADQVADAYRVGA